MNPICVWRQRALARLAVLSQPIPGGSSLSAHVACCAACRAVWNDLRLLSADLPLTLDTPGPSPSFTEGVWRRIDAAAMPRRSRWAALATTAAAIVLAAIVYASWNRNAGPPGAVPGRSAAAERNAVRPRLASGAPYSPKTATTGAKQAHRKVHPEKPRSFANASPLHAGVRRHAFHRPRSRHNVRIVRAPHPAPERPAGPPQACPPRLSWADWGAWYEGWGDYGRAADAYGKAYLEQPDPLHAFTAGRAAECAGDIGQAVEYYSRLLDYTPETKHKPGEGTLRWNREHGSA
jgi:hypothetical protein